MSHIGKLIEWLKDQDHIWENKKNIFKKMRMFGIIKCKILQNNGFRVSFKLVNGLNGLGVRVSVGVGFEIIFYIHFAFCKICIFTILYKP